ncbi:MAG: DUF3990 domain-containing protein [Lachnospiraceae bacterium]|nr:DUF3990 domain-containing protein [Lachnospiraceae bacterium]
MELFYHGTDIDSAKEICSNKKPDVRKGSRYTDFGQGFYITDNRESAEKWAFRKASLRNKKPALITITFDVEAAEPYIERFSDDLRWGRFIINNRNGLAYIKEIRFQENNLDARYPITFGRIADIEIRNVAKELSEKKEMLSSLDKILNPAYPIQYAFHTDEATKFIKKMSYQSLV